MRRIAYMVGTLCFLANLISITCIDGRVGQLDFGEYIGVRETYVRLLIHRFFTASELEISHEMIDGWIIGE